MSDLDDFFAKRLDEEARFPNRGKNWKNLSQRLDAFDAGTTINNGRSLRIWQAATLAMVIGAGFLLWKMRQTQQVNQTLHQEIATLQTERKNLSEQLADAELKNATQHAASSSENRTPSINKNAESLNAPQFDKIRHLVSPSAKSPSSLSASENLTVKAKNDTPVQTLKPEDKKQQEAENSNILAGNTDAIPAAPHQDAPNSESNEHVAAVNGSTPTEDSLQQKNTPSDTLQRVAETTSPAKDSIKQAPALAVNEIKPAHVHSKRFRIGSQVTVGFEQPQQKGVTALRGQGFTAEAKIFKSLWATASVDWLHHEVATENFEQRFHPHHDSLPKPPDYGGGGGGGGGGPHPQKLVLVECQPRQMNLSLGLRYELPISFWVQPSVRIAHDWTRISPTLVTYKYEEEDPMPPGPGSHDHDPEYTAEKFEKQWLSNQWRFGIGLEKSLPQWTFGLWADYAKDLSASTPAYDAIFVRAGAQFRF